MSGIMFAHEFSTFERCEAAAKRAKKEFDNTLMRGYYICVEK